MQKFNVLLIDDDENYCADFQIIGADYFKIDFATNGTQGLAKLKQRSPDIILLDYYFNSNETGLDILHRIRRIEPDIPVIMISEKTSVEVAVEAMKMGAYFYTSKFGSVQELLAIIEKEIEQIKRKILLERQWMERYDPLLGESPAMLAVKEKINRVARVTCNVLITGETGVGKELVAWRIHQLSKRRSGPFVAVNSGAIPENLFESELFGHKRGAFTGAISNHIGRFELAHQGTLFLDEIGNIPNRLQAKLLRVLDTRTVQRVGGNREIPVDVRIVAATNLNVTEAVQSGQFRNDLYHRLGTFVIEVPPLRYRIEDIPELADYFHQKFCRIHNRPGGNVSEDILSRLQEYPWPGNVRELKNKMEQLSILGEEMFLREFQLAGSTPQNQLFLSDSLLQTPYKIARREMMKKFQQFYFKSLVERFHGNVSKAAEWGGVPRSTIYRALKKRPE